MTEPDLKFSGDPAFSEYRRAMWAVMPKKIWLLTVLVGIPFLLLVLTGGLRVVLAHPGDQVPRLLFVFVLAAAPPVLAEYSIMKSWKRDPRVHASIRGDLTPDGIHYESGTVSGAFPWSSLRNRRNRGALLLIVTKCDRLLWFSPRFFGNDGEWQTAKALIEDKVRPK